MFYVMFNFWLLFNFQAYEVNLQLTAVISRLALLPHPYLHEFLLNTIIPRHTNADNLLQALLDTSTEMFSRVSVIPNYKTVLLATRQRLLGDIPENRWVNLFQSLMVGQGHTCLSFFKHKYFLLNLSPRKFYTPISNIYSRTLIIRANWVWLYLEL